MLCQLAPALAARGLPQHVISLTGAGALADRLVAAGVPITLVDLHNPVGVVAALPRVVRAVRRFDPDVIQGWMYHGDIVATLAHWLGRWSDSRRLVWGVRCSDMDLERHGLIIRLAACLSRFPDAVLVNSAAGAHVHRARGYRPRRLDVIPNGIDTDRFRPDPVQRLSVRRHLGITPEARVAIHVARVDPMKDHANVIAALRSIPTVTLLLVGAGTEALPLPPNCQGLGKRHDVPGLLAAADIVVSSSAFGEGFPSAVAEGMSAGLVPVVTDVGDGAMLVGDTGWVVPPRAPKALADAVEQAFSVHPDRLQWKARARAARQRIERYFSLDRSLASYCAVWKALLHSKR